ncbi:unnamed protein product, partial [Brenthis ino]
MIVTDGQIFDFIIVGGGSAGCVVANRLTEISDWSVLLIEAGDDPPYASEIPGLSVILGNNFEDWTYETVNDNYSSQALKNQKIQTVQGKMLGGSSNVNYMYYVRGFKENYEDWVARGNNGWNWNTLNKYYRRIEYVNYSDNLKRKSENPSDPYIGLTRSDRREQTQKYLDAFKENGHDIIEDRGFSQIGYYESTFNFYNKQRQSGSHVYIKPIATRKNLFILKKTVARNIILDNKIAVGVTVEEVNGVIKNIYARKEIILSAGSFNSPKLLMLSGIGPKKHLEQVGIHTEVHIQNVGSNLQDHMLVPIVISEGNGTNTLSNLDFLSNLDKFPAPAIMGHVALNRNQRYPDYQVTAFPLPSGSIFPTLMCSDVFKWNDDVCVVIANSTNQNILFSLISFLSPKSRGKIRLKSNNPKDAPLIFTGYFSNKIDQVKFANSIKDFISVVDTSYFRNVDGKVVNLEIEQCKNFDFNSQKYWECYVLNMASSQFHYSGTCAMGPEGTGVVDERLRVRGVKNLRVVDASIMPTIVGANTFATVVVIAEKGSEMIKSDHMECSNNDIFSNNTC